MNRLKLITIVAILLSAAGADWLRFRGDSTNSWRGQPPPVRWDVETGENIAWKVELPGKGMSSPIVVDGQVLVTASSGPRDSRLHVLAFDAASGREKWERQFWATGRTLHHPMSAVAANTPVSDGERVYAFYSSNDLVCLDLDGNLQWFRGLSYDYPAAANDAGMASSPLVCGDTVIVQIECQGESFAAGLDKLTGEDRWRIKRDRMPNWSSPVVMRAPDGSEFVLLQSAQKLSAHGPASGVELWTYPNKNDGIASSVVDGQVIYLPTAGAGLRAVRITDSAEPEVLWTQNKLNFGAGSPALSDGRVYTINRAGVLNCGRAGDGEILWPLRLKGAFWSTPLVAGDHLYAASQEGDVVVVKLRGDKGEIVATNAMGESLMASPAAADGALYYRGAKHLFKVAHK
jgi:outer membrane protein assembly factor BamB